MTFDLTTFLLEIVNFLVLVWLLQRFLYKPVLKLISERQGAIEQQVADANSRLAEAECKKTQYEDLLKQWENERADLLSVLRAEIQEEREKQLSKIRQEIEQESRRAQALSEMKEREEMRVYEQSALELAAQFTSKILSQLASAELEHTICKLFLSDLQIIPSIETVSTVSETGKNGSVIHVSSVFPFADDLKPELETALNKSSGARNSYEYVEDPALIAGVKVTVGGTVLEASLQDAPRFLKELGANAKRN